MSDGVYHVDGPLGQVRQMADWAQREADYDIPDRETLCKIATNLWAAADALEERLARIEGRLHVYVVMVGIGWSGERVWGAYSTLALAQEAQELAAADMEPNQVDSKGARWREATRIVECDLDAPEDTASYGWERPC